MTEQKNNFNVNSLLKETSLKITKRDKQNALSVIKKTPLPNTKIEAWKYTRVSKIGKIKFKNNEANIDDISRYIVDDTKYSFIFINGHFSNKHSSKKNPEGVEIKILSKKNEELSNSSLKIKNQIFNAINTFYLNDGLLIDIKPGTKIEKPIQIIHILKGDNIISNFKVIINAGESSDSSFVQGFFSDSGNNNFCNSTSEIKVAKKAKLNLDKIQFESEQSFHINTEQVRQEQESNFKINTFTLNGGIVRNNLNIDVNGQNCETHLNGAYLLKNKQHVDNHSIVDHKVANCSSHELYKGVIDDNSTAVFNGKVFVRKNAQKINAFQSNKNILLSDNASINSKPELEIYADDVKCSHGSTTGELDENSIFYLKTRGLSDKSARNILISAFFQDVINNIENQNVKKYISQLLNDRFEWNI